MSEHTDQKPKIVKLPGPDHPITIQRNPKQVVVSMGGVVLADSGDALILREAGLPGSPVHSAQGCRYDAARAERSCDLLPLQG
jgi:uncharacterized protein (DUF427 family)